MRKDLRDSALYEEHYRFKERRSNVRFFAVLFFVAFLLLCGRAYWVNHFGGVEVDGDSMYKTLLNGQQLIVRYAEGENPAERGDIVVVYVEKYPEIQAENEGKTEEKKLKYLIKRLIAVEGDVVKCVDGQIYIKEKGRTEFSPLEEPYAYYPSAKKKADYDFAEYTVGEGEIFFLGDNRCNSLDSRYQEGHSHLQDRLYKAEDIFGVVPDWAVEHRELLSKIFFGASK